MGNNRTPYSIALGHENIHFLTPSFKFIEGEKVNDNQLLKTNKGSVDPFDYQVSHRGKYSFKTLRIHKIHSNYT